MSRPALASPSVPSNILIPILMRLLCVIYYTTSHTSQLTLKQVDRCAECDHHYTMHEVILNSLGADQYPQRRGGTADGQCRAFYSVCLLLQSRRSIFLTRRISTCQIGARQLIHYVCAGLCSMTTTGLSCLPSGPLRTFYCHKSQLW
jgi:hypothetical protein